MIRLKKLGLAFALVGGTQVFASDLTPLQLRTQPVIGAEKVAMAPMSDAELSEIKGGEIRFAMLTTNQILMLATGGVAAMLGGNLANIAIKVGELSDNSRVGDIGICQTSAKIISGGLAQSQITAAREDGRVLDYVDMGVAMAYGFGVQFYSRGCSLAIHALQNKDSITASKSTEVTDKKHERLANAPSQSHRKLLMDKWSEHNRWEKWALDGAQDDRDAIEAMYKFRQTLSEQRNLCWSLILGAPLCYGYYEKEIYNMNVRINTTIDHFKGRLISVGQAQLNHVKSIGLPQPAWADLKTPTYDIN